MHYVNTLWNYLQPGSLAVAASYLVVVMGLLYYLKVDIWKPLGVSSLRIIVQLLFAGAFLVPFFNLNNVWLDTGALLAMALISAYTAVDSSMVGEELYAKALQISFFTMLVSTALVLVPVLVFGVVSVSTKFLIPIGAMLIRGIMNRQTLAFERFHNEMRNSQELVTTYLTLGFGQQAATRQPLRQAIKAALLPTINKNKVAGLVGIPGLMTGLLVAGVNPLTAAQLQAIVLWLILSGSVVSAVLVTVLMRSHYFDQREHLQMQYLTSNG